MLVWEKVRPYVIPALVILFALIYWWNTKSIFVDETFSERLKEAESAESLTRMIFNSPEMITMIRMTLFYFIPILAFTVLVYLLFSRFNKLSLDLGKYKLVMERHAMEVHGTQILDNAEKKSRKSIDQITYQIEKLDDFNRLVIGEGYDFHFYFRNFIIYLQELYCHKICNIRFAFYTISEQHATGYEFLGLISLDTPKIREFLGDLITKNKADYSLDLELRYPDCVTELEVDVVHNIIGSPVVFPTGEIFGVVLAYTKEDVLIFTQLDAYVLELLSHSFSLALGRINPRDILKGLLELDNVPKNFGL